jgi:excisionase family DNA binding protein
MNEEQREVLTLKEAADYLQVSPATLRAWAKRGRVAVARLGQGKSARLRFRREALLVALKQAEVEKVTEL